MLQLAKEIRTRPVCTRERERDGEGERETEIDIGRQRGRDRGRRADRQTDLAKRKSGAILLSSWKIIFFPEVAIGR